MIESPKIKAGVQLSVPVGEVESLLWCMRPALHLAHLRVPLPRRLVGVAPEDRPFQAAAQLSFRSSLVVTETTNQERALYPLVKADSTPVSASWPSNQERRTIFGSYPVLATIHRMRSALEGRVAKAVLWSLENQLYKVVTALAQYRAMDLSRFSSALVSTQHSPIIRAFFIAASEQSLPVVYVPHAPTAGNAAYLDLPVSYAGLRGRSEVAYYSQKLSIPSHQLNVVGNLASDVLTEKAPELKTTGPGVFALSPHDPEVIRTLFQVLGTNGLGEMSIAPHPRSDLNQIRAIAPRNWYIHENKRTLDLLKEGPPFVLQYSSGVAWESSALGIPTANIRIGDSPVNYPFLEDEATYPTIRDEDDTKQFVARARSGHFSRQRLRGHSQQWCSLDGKEASRALSDLLEQVASRPAPRSWLHDGWSAGGQALTTSWLSATAVAPMQ